MSFFMSCIPLKKEELILSYLFQLDALQQKAQECEQLCEKLTTLEIKMSTESDEKSQYEVQFRRNIFTIIISLSAYNFAFV